MKDYKSSLRNHFRNLRKSLVQSLGPCPSSFHENIGSFLGTQNKGLWTGYRAVGAELDIYLCLKGDERTWAFPKMVDSGTLEFFIPTDWQLGPHHIMEPDPEFSQKVSLENVEGCILPGVAYSRQGVRLGSGKGYYDKTLSNYSGVKVGVCYHLQLVEVLPSEAHDIGVDYIVTEKEILKTPTKYRKDRCL